MSKIEKCGGDYIVPVSLDTHVPPKSLPFFGNVSHAVLYAAEKNLGVLLDLLPNKVEAANAKLWLKMAVEFASVRAKVVNSIVWQKASPETRFEVALELEKQGEEVLKYLKKFKKHWNRVIEGVDLEAIAQSLPVPSYCKDPEEIVRHREILRRDIAIAVFNLSRIDSEFQQKLMSPRKHRRVKRKPKQGKQLSLFE